MQPRRMPARFACANGVCLLNPEKTLCHPPTSGLWPFSHIEVTRLQRAVVPLDSLHVVVVAGRAGGARCHLTASRGSPPSRCGVCMCTGSLGMCDAAAWHHKLCCFPLLLAHNTEGLLDGGARAQQPGPATASCGAQAAAADAEARHPTHSHKVYQQLAVAQVCVAACMYVCV